MNVFAELFGGALKHIDAEEVLKGVATSATASVAKRPLSQAFQKMKVEGRAALAGELETMAADLRAGKCDEAAGVGAEIIHNIKL